VYYIFKDPADQPSDATAKLSTFADEHKVPYLFLSDNDRKARQAYQVEKNFLGLSEGKFTLYSATCYREAG
jgi:peroxiredoxin